MENLDKEIETKYPYQEDFKIDKIMLGGAIFSLAIGGYNGINAILEGSNIPPGGLEGIINYLLIIPGITSAVSTIKEIRENKEKIPNKMLYSLKLCTNPLLACLETSLYFGVAPYIIGASTVLAIDGLIKNFNLF